MWSKKFFKFSWNPWFETSFLLFWSRTLLCYLRDTIHSETYETPGICILWRPCDSVFKLWCSHVCLVSSFFCWAQQSPGRCSDFPEFCTTNHSKISPSPQESLDYSLEPSQACHWPACDAFLSSDPLPSRATFNLVTSLSPATNISLSSSYLTFIVRKTLGVSTIFSLQSPKLLKERSTKSILLLGIWREWGEQIALKI